MARCFHPACFNLIACRRRSSFSAPFIASLASQKNLTYQFNAQ
jgi:hypothetical protein